LTKSRIKTFELLIISCYAKCWQEGVGRRHLAGGIWQEAVGRRQLAVGSRLNIAVAFKQLKQLAVRSSK